MQSQGGGGDEPMAEPGPSGAGAGSSQEDACDAAASTAGLETSADAVVNGNGGEDPMKLPPHGTEVFVGGLPRHATADQIKEWASQVGEVRLFGQSDYCAGDLTARLCLARLGGVVQESGMH